VKLLDPPGSDAIVVVGAAVAALGALVHAARWLAGRGAPPAPDVSYAGSGGSGQETKRLPVRR
jgi:hypothetical protein